jgi:glycosyltransferase involved in cell wall biosynthesis
MSDSPDRHIAFVGPMHPYRGGIAQFLEAMVRGFESRGSRVTAVTFTRQYPGLLFPGKSQLEQSSGTLDVRPLRTLDSIGPLSWWRTAREIARVRPDLVVLKYWMPFLAPAFGSVVRLLRRQGIPSVIVVDNAIPHERRPGDRLLGRYLLRAAKGLVVMSEAVEHDLHRLGITVPTCRVGHPVYDIFGPPQGSADARRALGLPEGAKVLLFFGFVRPYKGLQVLLEAMRRVADELPDAHLVVAGEFYEPEAPYREQIRKAGLTDRVHVFPDFIPSETVSRYFSAADLVVQPYLSATQSGVAQIAFHFEKPVLATDVGGLAETLGDGEAGLIVRPGDSGAVAAEVIRFFRENLAGRLVEGVRRRKTYYSWDRLLDAVESLV